VVVVLQCSLSDVEVSTTKKKVFGEQLGRALDQSTAANPMAVHRHLDLDLDPDPPEYQPQVQSFLSGSNSNNSLAHHLYGTQTSRYKSSACLGFCRFQPRGSPGLVPLNQVPSGSRSISNLDGCFRAQKSRPTLSRHGLPHLQYFRFLDMTSSLRGGDKALRYLQQLDSARCNALWDQVPELARKVEKHAPARKGIQSLH
jgi:hypothetical protein